MLTLFAIAALSIKFPGGTPNEFTALIAASTQRSVVLNQGDAHSLAEGEFQSTDIDEIGRVSRSKIGIPLLPGQDLVFSEQLLAESLVNAPVSRGSSEAVIVRRESGTIQREPAPTIDRLIQATAVALPKSAVEGGAITFKTEAAQRLALPSLNGVLSKPVATHWFYNDAVVFLNVDKLPEEDFVRWIAKAVGARAVFGAKDIRLELDPIEVRKRAIATINRIAARTSKTNPMALKNAQFRVNALNTLSVSDLNKALASDGAELRIEIAPRGNQAAIAIQRIRDLEQYEATLPPGAGNPRRATGLLQQVDSSRAAVMIVGSKFQVSLEIPIRDRNGRPNGIVRLQ